MISYGERSDFLGSCHGFGLCVSVNYIAMCFPILTMRHIYQRRRRDADQDRAA